MRSHALRCYWILAPNEGNDFIEFRQGSNGPDEFSHRHSDERRRPLGLGRAVVVPRARIHAIACLCGTTRAFGRLASSSALRMWSISLSSWSMRRRSASVVSSLRLRFVVRANESSRSLSSVGTLTLMLTLSIYRPFQFGLGFLLTKASMPACASSRWRAPAMNSVAKA